MAHHPRILLIRFGSFGDLVLTTPTIINLKIQFPGAHVTFLTKERFRTLVELFDGVDEILTLPEETSGLSYAASLLQEDARSYDLIIDLHGNPRSWLTRMLTYAPQKLVYPKRRLERRRIVRTKQYPDSFPHTIDLYNATVIELGAVVHSTRPVIASGRLPQSNSDAPYICIAPEAAHENKAYPLAGFVEIAKQLHERSGKSIVWLLTKKNQALETLLANTIPASGTRIAVGLAWPELAAAIANADLTISNDSGVAHLSSAVGTPVIAIFGPTHPSLGFSPRGQFDQVLDAPVWCRPCSLHGKRPCFRERRYCFDAVTPAQAANAGWEILGRRSNTKPALFIDRDGTLIEEREFMKDPAQVVLTPEAAEALRQARAAGYALVVVSNQSGVARGLMTIDDVEAVNSRVSQLLAEQGVELDLILYCPEFIDGNVPVYAKQSYRRKPSPGMVEEAAAKLGVDPRRSSVIGDKLDDLNLARTSGARPYLVRTGYGEKSAQALAGASDRFLASVPVSSTLAEAVSKILAR